MILKADTFPDFRDLLMTTLSPYKSTRKERKQINTYLDLIKQRENGSLTLFSALHWLIRWHGPKVLCKLLQYGHEILCEPIWCTRSTWLLVKYINYDLKMAIDVMWVPCLHWSLGTVLTGFSIERVRREPSLLFSGTSESDIIHCFTDTNIQPQMGNFDNFGISDFGTFALPDPEHSPEEALLSYHPSPRYFLPLPLLQNTQSP